MIYPKIETILQILKGLSPMLQTRTIWFYSPKQFLISATNRYYIMITTWVHLTCYDQELDYLDLVWIVKQLLLCSYWLV